MDESHFLADCTQAQHAMISLCLNASDALSPDSGAIEIAVEKIMRPSKGANRVSTDFVILAVHDNGHGISEEHRQRIFEPFCIT